MKKVKHSLLVLLVGVAVAETEKYLAFLAKSGRIVKSTEEFEGRMA